MTWSSIALSNVFLAAIALTNLVILLILYQHFGKSK
jgi:high-affinity nickel permease